MTSEECKAKAEEFRKKYGLRRCEKCCATCKFGEIGYDGSVECLHPDLGGVQEYVYGTWQFCVCDAWKKAKGRRFPKELA